MRLKEDPLCLFPKRTECLAEKSGRNSARGSLTAAEAGASGEIQRARFRPLVTRDIDLLPRITRCGRTTVQITLLTLNPTVTRIVERRTPPPRLRLETIRALHTAGIEVGLFVMPLLPGITDTTDEMRTLLRAAKEAGAGEGPSRVLITVYFWMS